jgi:3-isopropylmalate dehydratase small subunit
VLIQLLICIVEKINKELSRLEDEESQAEVALAEAFARISHLWKMQKQLRKKGVEILKKGLDDIEALEEEERREAEEKNRREDLEYAQAREAELVFQI